MTVLSNTFIVHHVALFSFFFFFFDERILPDNTQGPRERSGHCRQIDREPASIDPFGGTDASPPRIW